MQTTTFPDLLNAAVEGSYQPHADAHRTPLTDQDAADLFGWVEVDNVNGFVSAPLAKFADELVFGFWGGFGTAVHATSSLGVAHVAVVYAQGPCSLVVDLGDGNVFQCAGDYNRVTRFVEAARRLSDFDVRNQVKAGTFVLSTGLHGRDEMLAISHAGGFVQADFDVQDVRTGHWRQFTLHFTRSQAASFVEALRSVRP